MMKKTFLYILILISTCMGAKGQAVGDSIVASLLTCSPGTKSYSLYGHTGLRIRNLTQGLDLVFNYGVFNFQRPHFTWHFILGECDYEVAAYPFDAFVEEYAHRGSSVVEQQFNLTPEETNRLFSLLVINCQPENKVYRYNFLQNNCTTKARDIVEQAVVGEVRYEEAQEHPTYRQLLHEMTEDYPWSEVGNDLLLGAACDTVLSDRATQFLPGQLMEYAARAQIFDEKNNRRPLVARTSVLLEANAHQRQLASQGGWEPRVSPLVAGLMALAAALLVMLVEYLTRRQLWGIDILLMLLQGLAGVLLTFMLLFSQHPTVDSNWQVWVFNPLPLLCIVWVVKCAIRQQRCLYHYLNLLVLVLFVVLMPWIPQTFSALTLPLALVLLTRPVSYLIRYNRKPKEA